MKHDMGYCPKCNCTTAEHNLEHVHEEHYGGGPQILGLLPMWYNRNHSGPQRAGEFWARRFDDDY